MKSIVIFAFIILMVGFASAQKNDELKEIEITAPQFTGVQNATLIQNEYPNTQIKNFLSNNIVYPKVAESCYMEGTEVVEFTVTTEGNLKDFKIINSVCSKIDDEVISVLRKTNGMWVPGIKNGVATDMTMEIPFVFCASKSSSKSTNEIFKEKAINYFNKGNEMLHVKGNTKKALKNYSNGVTLLPYDKGLLFLRGLCRFELGDKKGANDDWLRLRDMGDVDMSEYITLIKDMTGYDEMLAIIIK